MSITIKNIHKKFGSFTALNDVSLDIKPGELVALLGPSGSGKTTLLRIIAGLDFADKGEVILEGQQNTGKPVRERKVGFMFQHYALFRHMTVFENVAFSLRVQEKKKRLTDPQIRRKVLDLLDLVHLDGLHDRYPSQLSGGQRQRVALARALAVQPKVLLLDEPFGALDAKVRKELRRFLRRLHEEIHVTTVFVTHDQEEAMEVADRVVVMSNGKIEQVGTPGEVWNSPCNSFVYDFLGNYNQFEGWKDAAGKIHLTEYDVVSTAADIPAPQLQPSWLGRYPKARQLLKTLLPHIAEDNDTQTRQQPRYAPVRGEGKNVRLYARPHEMFVATDTNDGEEYITAKITHINPAGALVTLELERRNGTVLQAEIPAQVLETLKLEKHNEVFVRPRKTKVFE